MLISTFWTLPRACQAWLCCSTSDFPKFWCLWHSENSSELPRVLLPQGNCSQNVPGVFIFPSQQQTGLWDISQPISNLKSHFSGFSFFCCPQGSSSPQGIWIYLSRLPVKLQSQNEAGNDEVTSMAVNLQLCGLQRGWRVWLCAKPFKISQGFQNFNKMKIFFLTGGLLSSRGR